MAPRKQAWADQFGVTQLRGGKLGVAVSIEARLSAALQKEIDVMIRETMRAVRDLRDDHGLDDIGMDASIASQARIVFNLLTAKFFKRFNDISGPLSKSWMGQIDKNSAATLGISLKDIAGNMTLKTDVLNGELRESLSASVNEAVDLIKRVPDKYFDQIKGEVMRSIQIGGKENNLTAALDKYGVQTKNWAKNVAMDQTRKAYMGITTGRMAALGIDEYEWLHSGGSQYPRKFHRDVLNGKICKISDPPVIVEGTDIKGIPGQLPYCRCTMRPIFKFPVKKDDAT